MHVQLCAYNVKYVHTVCIVLYITLYVHTYIIRMYVMVVLWFFKMLCMLC